MLRRSTILMLLTGAAAAVFSYTPTAAQWLAIGKDQGYVPAQVPVEMTEPPLVPAAVVTVAAFALAWLVRAMLRAFGESDVRSAIAGEAVRQRIDPPAMEGTATHGREIISNRTRRAEIRRDIEAADAERQELARELTEIKKEDGELVQYIAMAEVDVVKAEKECDWRRKERDDLRFKRTNKQSRGLEITAKLEALAAVKTELLAEQRDLA